jgi:hypothetical protein
MTLAKKMVFAAALLTLAGTVAEVQPSLFSMGQSEALTKRRQKQCACYAGTVARATRPVPSMV